MKVVDEDDSADEDVDGDDDLNDDSSVGEDDGFEYPLPQDGSLAESASRGQKCSASQRWWKNPGLNPKKF